MTPVFLFPATIDLNNYNAYIPIKENNKYNIISKTNNYNHLIPIFHNDLIMFRVLKSNDENQRFIIFKNSFIVTKKEIDNLIMLEWIEDPDLFGMGETLEESQVDLLYNIEGVLLMKNFTEEELSSDAKTLLEKVITHIKETNIIV